MWFFPFLLDDPPAGDTGQGESPPAGSDKGDKGQGDKPPADAKGQGDEEIQKKAKSYDELFPKFTNLSKERGRLAEKAKEFGFGEDEVETFLDEAVTEIRRMDAELKTLKGEKPPDSDDKDKDKDKDKSSGLSEKIMGHINTATKFSLDAKKDSQYNAFLRKHPDFDENLREDLDKEIDEILRDTPTALKSGNWYDKAMRAKSLKSDDFLTKIEQKAVEKENKRLQNLKDQELVTGGASAGGASKTLEKELKERLG